MKRALDARKPEAKAKSAWLVTWDGTSGVPEDRVVAILNYRMSASSVKEFVELLYVTLNYTPREKLLYANNPRDNPYPATITVFQKISCGANPSLYARQVTGLKVVDGKPTWTEPLSDPERRKKIGRG
jgi:hypothetical protein